MLNRSFSLKEFVDPLPICPPETDLGSMLRIFQHLRCQMLAIPQDKLGWGVINSEDILSMVADVWLSDRLTVTSHPKSVMYQQTRNCRLIPDVKTLIKPAIVYQGETKLDEFLSSLKYNSWLSKERVCLIVNQQGELEGRLDQDKILEYLALRVSSDCQQDSKGNCATYPQDNPPPTRVNNSPSLVLASPQNQSQVSQNTNLDYRAKASINQLLTTVSHELKSPLTGIIGLSSLLQGQELGSLNQRQTRYADLIYRSGKTMIRVVDDLLQFTNLMADQPRDGELINLESLCHHLYQEVLTRVYSIQGKSPSNVDFAQPKLSIKLEDTIAIAEDIVVAKQVRRTQPITKSTPIRLRSESSRIITNKLLLSAVLSHLMLEAMVVDETIELSIDPLKIQITSLAEQISIEITSSAIETRKDPGLNFMIAQCLSAEMKGHVIHNSSSNSYQLSLCLPKKNIQSLPLKDTTASPSPILKHGAPSNLTILCLYPELEVIDSQTSHDYGSNFDLKSWSDNYVEQTGYQHRIIEADSLEQAHNLARIWQLDVIILNGYQLAQPSLYLRSLQESDYLACLPLITLDTKTTEAANQITGLNVYPCLLPTQQCNIENLIQVIQIALEADLS